MSDMPMESPLPDGCLEAASEQGASSFRSVQERVFRYAIAHRRSLDMADYAESLGVAARGQKLRNCGHFLLFHDYYTIGESRLVRAYFCQQHLLCPFCAIRRADKYLQGYLARLEALRRSEGNFRAFLVTLTVKDGPDLLERFKHLTSSLAKMTQARRDRLKAPHRCPPVEFAKALGGVYSIEFKRGKNSGEWHPHVHMVWLCHEAPDQTDLSHEWRRWTGDSFIVDVTPFHDQAAIASGFMEVFKYAVKFSDLPLVDNWHAFEVLTRRRLIGSFGIMRGVFIPDDLQDEPIEALPFFKMLFQWLGAGSGAGYSLLSSRQVVPPHVMDE